MKQVEIPRYGPPEVLTVVERADPEPGAGQVRVAVAASGINFADLVARMGLYQDAPKPPLVVGYDVSGTIDRVGDGVDADRVGQRVIAMTRFGGYSSKVVVPAAAAVAIPEGMTFEQGAALPVVYMTAYHMLVYLGNLHEGERVLIHSAGGGVGIAAIQLARWKGAEIFGTASSWKHERLREMGVHHCIDYRSEDFEAVIKEITGGRGVHLAIDAIGGNSFRKSYRSLGKTGRLFCFGMSSAAPGQSRNVLRAGWEFVKMPFYHPIRLMLDNKGVFGVNMGQMWDQMEVMTMELRATLDLFVEGVVEPIVDRTYPAEEAPEAHRYVQERKNFGKVLLTFGD